MKNHTMVWPGEMHGLRQIQKWFTSMDFKELTTSRGKLYIPSKKDHRPKFGY